MRKVTNSFHNFRGKAGGTARKFFHSFPQLEVYSLFIHRLFTGFPLGFSRPVWRIHSQSTDSELGFPPNPQALLLLSTSFKNLMRVVKELFKRSRLTIIGGQIGV